MSFLAFISTGEILFALFVGLLLFGGKLPEVAKDIGKVFYKLRRSVQEMRQESGIDDALRDIRREVEDATPRVPRVDLRKSITEALDEPKSAAPEEKGLPGGGAPETPAEKKPANPAD